MTTVRPQQHQLPGSLPPQVSDQAIQIGFGEVLQARSGRHGRDQAVIRVSNLKRSIHSRCAPAS